MNAGTAVSWLRTLAERTLHPLTVERVIAPAFDDLEHECSTSSSRRARVGAYAAIIKTVVVCMAGDAVRDRDRHSLPLLVRFVAGLAIIAGLLTLPTARWHVSFAETSGVAAALSAYFFVAARSCRTPAMATCCWKRSAIGENARTRLVNAAAGTWRAAVSVVAVTVALRGARSRSAS